MSKYKAEIEIANELFIIHIPNRFGRWLFNKLYDLTIQSKDVKTYYMNVKVEPVISRVNPVNQPKRKV